MDVFALSFRVAAGLILLTTGLALTRKNLVEAVLFLILSFLGTALLFYLFGAPLLAALHVLIYAGAIMVLFLLVVTMSDLKDRGGILSPRIQWIPAALIAAGYLAAALLVRAARRGADAALGPATLPPRDFGQHLFQKHWLSVELVSTLLVVALLGVLLLARQRSAKAPGEAP